MIVFIEISSNVVTSTLHFYVKVLMAYFKHCNET